MYCMTVDEGSGIIDVGISGFWSTAMVERFAVDLRAAIHRVRVTGRRHCMLYDYSAAAIQSQEVIGALQLLAATIETPAERTALFTRGRFARLQAARIAAVRDGIRLFDDRQCAWAWLTDRSHEAAPLAPPVGMAAG